MSGAWLNQWLDSPLEKKISNDRRAYTANQFSRREPFSARAEQSHKPETPYPTCRSPTAPETLNLSNISIARNPEPKTCRSCDHRNPRKDLEPWRHFPSTWEPMYKGSPEATQRRLAQDGKALALTKGGGARFRV